MRLTDKEFNDIYTQWLRAPGGTAGDLAVVVAEAEGKKAVELAKNIVYEKMEFYSTDTTICLILEELFDTIEALKQGS